MTVTIRLTGANLMFELTTDGILIESEEAKVFCWPPKILQLPHKHRGDTRESLLWLLGTCWSHDTMWHSPSASLFNQKGRINSMNCISALVYEGWVIVSCDVNVSFSVNSLLFCVFCLSHFYVWSMLICLLKAKTIDRAIYIISYSLYKNERRHQTHTRQLSMLRNSPMSCLMI